MFEASLFQYLGPSINKRHANTEPNRTLFYTGKISFGFYLVHGPVMWTVGDRLNAAVGRPRGGAGERAPGWTNLFPLSDAGPLGLEINALVPHIILLPLTLWLAGVVTKLIDLPSAKLSKWVFQQRIQSPKALAADSEMEAMLVHYSEQLPR